MLRILNQLKKNFLYKNYKHKKKLDIKSDKN